MTVARDIMSTEFPSVSARDTLLAATQRMVVDGVAALPVLEEDGALTAVLNYSDVVRLVAQGAHASQVTLAGLSAGAVHVDPDRPVEDVRIALHHSGSVLVPVVE